MSCKALDEVLSFFEIMTTPAPTESPTRMFPDGSPDFEKLLAHDIPPGESSLAEILRLSNDADISLAGGLPAPRTFPDEVTLTQRAQERLKLGESNLQYGSSGGLQFLCESALPWLRDISVQVSVPEQILVTTGSQAALSAAGRAMLERPGEYVAVESPTYLGLLDALREYHPNYVVVESDENGMKPDSLEEVLSKYPVKFAYTVPDFANPTGITMTLERRNELAAVLRRCRALLWEDTPYGQLRYEGDSLPTIQSLAPENTAFFTTTSKVLAPGLRIGLAVVPGPLAEKMTTISGGRYLCPSKLAQAIAGVYFADGDIYRHVPEIVDFYRPRRDAMDAALHEFFPSDWQWVRPNGGMFFWPWGPEGIDTKILFQEALRRKVAFVPGHLFHPEPGVSSAMRLNFSLPDEDAIREGIRVIGQMLHQV